MPAKQPKNKTSKAAAKKGGSKAKTNTKDKKSAVCAIHWRCQVMCQVFLFPW